MEILDTCHCHFESFCHFFIYIMGLEQKFRIWTIMFGAQFGFVNGKKNKHYHKTFSGAVR